MPGEEGLIEDEDARLLALAATGDGTAFESLVVRHRAAVYRYARSVAAGAADAEDVLQALELPYRILMLATGDISFAAAKCYDIELYAPGTDAYLEVSSCSNFTDFQARRANIKFKQTTNDERRTTKYVHTLNGSGVALARLVVAILENYQNKDGSVNIPKALVPYMDGVEVIKPC